MEIKKYQPDHTSALVELWYEASVKAHHFIPAAFWEQHKAQMAQVYLPNSRTFVAFRGEVPAGFISMSGNNLAALFVSPELQGMGIGSRLLDLVKANYMELHLKVYTKNGSAVQFYLKQGFVPVAEDTDEATGEMEISMSWNAPGQFPGLKS